MKLTRERYETRPVERTANLLAYFGWQGGTIHQLADETGVDVDTLLHAEAVLPLRGKYLSALESGQFAANTCGLLSRLELAKLRKGNVDYWLGVACSKTGGQRYAIREAK